MTPQNLRHDRINQERIVQPGSFQARVMLLSLLGLLSACAHTLDVNVKAGACLNPRETTRQAPCQDAAQDSRPVEVRFYPLSACPAKGSAKWADLLESEQAEQTLGKLRLGGDQALSIERIEQRTLRFNPLPKGTTCVLAVVVGRGEGESSVVPIPLQGRKTSASFQLNVYDLVDAQAAQKP